MATANTTNGLPGISVITRPCISALVTISDSNNKRRCGFRPSRSQEDVHNAITAPTYIGKDEDTFLNHVRISKATKFLAHPAVTPRLDDIEFGPCGLLMLHFTRLDIDDQIRRQKQNKISTKVELPDIPILAYWFSNVFAAYRLAVVNDIVSGSNTRATIQIRFNMHVAGNRQLCLRYKSKQGCTSKSRDRCVQSYLTHFEQTELPEAVATYINEQLGGVNQIASVKLHPDEQ
ncbi:hypothetical protein PHMEG_00012521 [Phytophthora megakarya]|uniref:Uncharacterized protein n=1 Tax=Phytophthora megakarya TaxID=4795 RepID=A0A225WB45_9STRA|nr:hypothetical protein PHMEG_00012521 [Phytophthora megakarya]